MCYAFLVLDFCKLGGPFVIHLGLQVSADGTVALANLPENVSLVLLLGKGVGHGLRSKGLVLARYLSFQVGLLVLLEPLRLIF